MTAILRKTALFIALLLAVLTIFNSLAGPVAFAAPQKFTDVPANAWYFSYVENLANKNIVSGYGSGEFRPDNNVQRQHVCKMVVLA
ncbi:MAG: S-layer homology domain-containing protein, partial [Clostridiaceae bacterium]|nr:S-layer homology domain-containing protein [Clostridiaceae bacterium]